MSEVKFYPNIIDASVLEYNQLINRWHGWKRKRLMTSIQQGTISPRLYPIPVQMIGPIAYFVFQNYLIQVADNSYIEPTSNPREFKVVMKNGKELCGKLYQAPDLQPKVPLIPAQHA